MAFIYPSQAQINRRIEDLEERQRLNDLDRRFQAEDRRTVSTERGPVRGYPGGGRSL